MNKKVQVKGGLVEGQAYVFVDGAFQPLVQEQVVTTIPRPGEGYFRKESMGDITGHLLQQEQPAFELDETVSPGTDHVGIAYPETGGTFVYLKGLLFPTKGFPHPEAVQAANIVKRVMATQLRALVRNPLHVISLLYKKNLYNWLQSINETGTIALGAYFPALERMSKAPKALMTMVNAFTDEYGLPKDISGFGYIVGTVFDYDNAYMLRVQDLANETTADALCANPAQELARLFGILQERDARQSMRMKVGNVVWLLSLGFLIPGFKRAFRKAVRSIDWSDIQMDDGDRYQVLRWNTYNFLGKSFEERVQEFFQMHEGNIPQAFILKTP